ncbi:S-adenosylmethionine synthetase [Enterococcus cecorum]|uniref:methionine adenosyltransferase n=1 Tax=Enterococcus cecorum TaxID=44008 RepID=UPI000E00F264|nr:methionine adenosyltransferase [Enterococcus cecorum]STP81983.1 S-adenosylmethionine synthetase [Enterococcus cecorum]
MDNLKIKEGYKVELDYEIVERKGSGHPDTLCDAIAERCSYEYCKYFKEKFNRYAHHWFDKVVLVGGRSDIRYGVGKIIEPYKILICGKCVKRVGDYEIPVYQIFQRAVDFVLTNTLTGYNAEQHRVIIDYTVDSHGTGRKSIRYQPREVDELQTLLMSENVSNDCNILSAHYPLSVLESSVLNLEKYLNSFDFKKILPQSGWDIKITGVKINQVYEYVVNVPILASMIRSKEEYYNYVDIIRDKCRCQLEQELGEKKYKLIVNPQDSTGEPYITSLGSAADTGDVGVVGRGNRSNGLISPMRSMSIEAASGKNSMDHTGKIYTLMVHKISKDIYKKISKANQVHITTYKELPLVSPQQVIVEVEGKIDKSEEYCIQELISYYLSEVGIQNLLDQLTNEYNCFW